LAFSIVVTLKWPNAKNESAALQLV
jgi:hypothetical protein